MSLAATTQAARTLRDRLNPRALLGACHPGPTVGVTAFATYLSALAGNHGGTTSLLAGAVLSGQLSIGWSNDRIDAARDRRVGRADKPVAQGLVSARQIDAAIAVALACTIGLSLSLGVRAGIVHLVAVSGGWAYNLGLKRTVYSGIPYVLAFGALPAVATLAGPRPQAPALWVVGAGACLGLVAHLTNALPDFGDDEQTGIRGLPHRIGRRASITLCAILIVVQTLLVVVGPSGRPTTGGWLALAISTALATGGSIHALRHPRSHQVFYGVFLIVAVDLGLLTFASGHLV
jgi:4-hydroxybenzoate polyprenyltransferase